MDFIDSVIMTRASARNFTGEALPRETLLRVAKAGMAAPSAVNVQPWEILIVTERAKLDALCSSLPYAKMLGKAAAAFVVCGDPRKDEVFAKDHWPVDCAAVSENILLAAHALGLGAVWTAVYPDESRLAATRRVLGIPDSIVPLNVIPIGVIAGQPPAPKDKWNPKAIHFDLW
jgi:nitroreductase